MADAVVRLLFCHTCRSVDEVPDYQGPVEHDYYLQHKVSQHQFESGNPHRGVLGRVENTPESINAAIDEMETMVQPGTGVGMGQVMYDLRDNYREEAFRCWKSHNRTKDCGDYMSDRMRLWADTKADRKSEGLSTNREERPNIWLCEHCPVHSLVEQARNEAKLK